MMSNANVRNYRAPHVNARLRRRTVPRLSLVIVAEHRRHLTLAASVAMALGLCITQLIHGQMNATRTEIAQLESVNRTLGNDHIRLRARRAHLTSKQHIAALAGVKLRLFEPEKGQVHRM